MSEAIPVQLQGETPQTAPRNLVAGETARISEVHNTGLGNGALPVAPAGKDNTAIGYHAGASIGTGELNTALGSEALAADTSGKENTAIGYKALTATTTGTENTAIGAWSADSNTTGKENVAVGVVSLTGNTTGQGNVAVGAGALWRGIEPQQNTCIGYLAGEKVKSYGNVYLGAFAGVNAEGSVGYAEAEEGVLNVGIGWQALEKTTKQCVGIGARALRVATSEGDIAIGHEAMVARTLGGFPNVAIGYRALRSLTVGAEAGDVAIGWIAAEKSTGGGLTVIGFGAHTGNTTGEGNTIVGAYSLFKTTTGGHNTCIGFNTGNKLTGESTGNVFVGYEAGPAAEGEQHNKLYIHNSRTANPLIWGDFVNNAGELKINATKIGLYGVAPAGRAAAIPSPAAELAALKGAVDAIREAIKNIGITE